MRALPSTLRQLFNVLVCSLPFFALGQGITPTSSVTVGQTVTYNYTDDMLYTTKSWTATLGSVGSSGRTGSTYWVNINWTSPGTATVSFYGNNVLRSSVNISVICPGTADPTPTFSANPSPCAPRSVSYTGTPPSGITWYWQTSAAGSDMSNSTNSYSASYTSTVYVRARDNSTGCWSSGAASYAVSVSQPPSGPPTPSATSNSCGPKTVSYSGSAPSGVNWYWQTSSSGTDTSPTAAAATYIVSATGSIWIYLRARDASSGCWSQSAPSVLVTINDPPTPNTPSASSASCGTQTLTANGSPPSNVTWYWQGTNAVGTSTTYLYSTPYSAPSTGTYYLRAYSTSYGCWSQQSAGVSVNVNPYAQTPAASVTVSTNTCGPKTATVTGTPPTNEYWYWQGTNPNGTSTSQSTSVMTYFYTTGTYYIRAYNSNGCWSQSSQSVSITVNDPPAPNTPTTTPMACGNQTLAYPGSAPANTSWYWQGTSSSGTDNSPTAAAPTYSASATGTYYLRALNTMGCWSQTSTSVSVTITFNAPAAPPIALATTNTCDIRTLTKPAAPNGVTYYWEVNPGDTDFTSANATSATLQAGQTGNYYLRAKDNNGPCWSSATTISMNVNPVDITVSAFDPVNYVVQATHSIRLLPGFYANSGNSFSAKISITPECNNLTNWNEQIVYNEQGAIISDTRTYTNGFGTPAQTQNKDLISGLIWGSQSLFNSYSKPVGSTLPAPLLENDFVYKNSLALNASGTPYGPADFDLRTTIGASGELNNPKPFGTQPGSVGWYYSSNNDKESLTPITQYPYSRGFVAEDPEPTSSVSADPGDMHRMGSGHNPESDRYLITTNELSHYYSLRSYFTNSISTGGIGYKYVSTDANGKQSVTFVDADGRTVASAMVQSVSGTPPNLTFTYDYWSYTYYNDAGQITATVAPEDVNTGSSAQPSATLFGYDHMGRMIETTSPDEGTSRFVYSTDGKIRFSENQEQRNATPKRFSYTNYDYLGMLVESGEYTCVTGGGYVFEPETTATPATNSILNIIDNNLTVPIESVNAGNYTGVSYKLDATRCAQYNFITYDIPGSGTPKVQNYLYGQISKTESPSAVTWYSYDETGRLTWTRQNIYGLGIKSINYT